MVSIDTCMQVRPVCWRAERGPGTRDRSGQDVWLHEHHVQNDSTPVEQLVKTTTGCVQSPTTTSCITVQPVVHEPVVLYSTTTTGGTVKLISRSRTSRTVEQLVFQIHDAGTLSRRALGRCATLTAACVFTVSESITVFVGESIWCFWRSRRLVIRADVVARHICTCISAPLCALACSGGGRCINVFFRFLLPSLN